MNWDIRYAKEQEHKDHYKYIKKQGDSWVVIQKGTGKVLSHHDSREKAIASFKAMMMNKHGKADSVSAIELAHSLGLTLQELQSHAAHHGVLVRHDDDMINPSDVALLRLKAQQSGITRDPGAFGGEEIHLQ